MLSLRTKDAVTAVAVKRLLRESQDTRELLEVPEAELARLIYPVGFYKTKAKVLREVARTILEKHEGAVPDTLEGLLELKGVGRKTANLVLTQAFGKPGICVDTHVHRITNRWGYVPDEDARRDRAGAPREAPRAVLDPDQPDARRIRPGASAVRSRLAAASVRSRSSAPRRASPTGAEIRSLPVPVPLPVPGLVEIPGRGRGRGQGSFRGIGAFIRCNAVIESCPWKRHTTQRRRPGARDAGRGELVPPLAAAARGRPARSRSRRSAARRRRGAGSGRGSRSRARASLAGAIRQARTDLGGDHAAAQSSTRSSSCRTRSGARSSRCRRRRATWARASPVFAGANRRLRRADDRGDPRDRRHGRAPLRRRALLGGQARLLKCDRRRGSREADRDRRLRRLRARRARAEIRSPGRASRTRRTRLLHPVAAAAALAGLDPIALWHSFLLAIGLTVALGGAAGARSRVVAAFMSPGWLAGLALGLHERRHGRTLSVGSQTTRAGGSRRRGPDRARARFRDRPAGVADAAATTARGEPRPGQPRAA